MEYDQLTIEKLLYRPLCSSPGCKRIEPDSKYSDLIWTVSIQLHISRWLFFRSSRNFSTVAISKCFLGI